MKIGKLPETVLKRSVLQQIQHRRKEVLCGAAIGEDCSVLQLEEDDLMILSMDPITATEEDIGTLAVHITANDLASDAAELIGIMVTILLPPATEEQQLKNIMQQMEAVCEQLQIEIMGGHTEVTEAVTRPVITVTGIGKVKKGNLTTTAGAKAGQEIVLTKWIGIEGTAILAAEKEAQLRQKYSAEFLEQAKQLKQWISVVPESCMIRKVGKQMGVTAMHDITEGGVFGALWELAEASRVGLEVDIRKIPVKQETIEICEYFAISPYALLSSGSLLIVTDRGYSLVEEFKKAGIHASVIGKLTDGNDRILRQGDGIRYLEPPKTDEIYRV